MNINHNPPPQKKTLLMISFSFLGLLSPHLSYLPLISHSLCHFANDIMFSAADPVTYFHSKENERQRGMRGRWYSIQSAINRAVSGGALLKKKGEGCKDERGG